MAEIVTMMRKENQGNWGLALVLKKRKALLRIAPMSPEIIEIEKWLVTQPLSTRDLIKVWSRMIRALLFEYGDAAADRKREILLFLREQHRAMPLRIREGLWEIWFQWLDEFEEEEIAAGDRAESDREYVWTPEARDEMRAQIKKEKARANA
jgi:hypothetical protein